MATSIYRDYKLESQIQRFEQDINELAEMAQQKPEDVMYFASKEYKDRYAKESLGLLNPGEKLLIIPDEEQVIERGPVELMTDKVSTSFVLEMSNRQQWWQYFFGQTLSIKLPAQDKVEEEVVEEEIITPEKIESIIDGDTTSGDDEVEG
ncbi:hypothetical protein KJ742_00815 [Patescibacteria group bacterium]|nr:hypothetical protein [Patescibacteria group bacterium]MBU1682464.1 hypothetical protein [Patescibacteria group bacterium]